MSFCINTFDFIPSDERIMYETAFNSITQLELWDYLKNFDTQSFMFSNNEEIQRIYNKIEELGYTGHSGSSFGFIMRSMEYIAKNGLTKFEEEYTMQNSCCNKK
jgi:hypothetical protein